jgi:molybdenum cofactor cytidylyltransferase
VIAAVVLAAGLSRRMGRPKLLLPLAGRPVIRVTVDLVARAGLDDVVVVVGPEPEAMARALEGTGVRLVVNPAPEAGQASSIAAGIAALRSGTRAAIIVLGDQPALPPEILARLVETFNLTGQPVVAPRYLDGTGTPVLFAASVFPELARLTGDRGARAVLERVPERVALVPFDIPRPADLDTPEDWERLAGGSGVH